MSQTKRIITQILNKYPCDANGIMTVGIDFLRYDLEKAFGVKPRRRKLKGQCRHRKSDKQGGYFNCLLPAGHAGIHRFWPEYRP